MTIVDFEEFSVGDGPMSWGSAGVEYIYSKGYRITGGTIAGPAEVFTGSNNTKVFGDDIAGFGQDSFGFGVQIIVEHADGDTFEVHDVDALLQVDAAGSTSIRGSVVGGGVVNSTTAYGTGDWLNVDQLVFNAVGNGFGFGTASAEIDNIKLSALPIHIEEASFYSDQIPDPTLPWWLAHDWYASAVAIDDDTAVVGAAHEGGPLMGAVYVYVRDPLGNWTQQAKISNPTGVFNFGKSVSISKDTILITALDAGDYQGTGYAYIYVRNGNNWSLQQSLFGESNDLDGFGYAGSIHEDTAVVTAWHDDDQGKNAGAAHVFTRNGEVWTREAKLYSSDADAADHFGRAVDIEGNTLAVNSMLDLNPEGLYAGNAYVFVRENSIWVEQAKLEANDGLGADNMGVSIDINRNFIALGALGDDSLEGDIDRGSAYIFKREQCTWIQHAKIEPDQSNQFMSFGRDLSIQGNTLIVGASGYEDSGVRTGAVYLFNRFGNKWLQDSKIIPDEFVSEDIISGNLFGLTVDMSNNIAIIGSSPGLQGKAYMFNLGTDNLGWEPQSAICFDGCHP
ncbi:MAG: FG-GAP repeat protein [Pseudomonadota bacterium]|nr:FG-GAP repeat protein [Pseudomonadota bacterium]